MQALNVDMKEGVFNTIDIWHDKYKVIKVCLHQAANLGESVGGLHVALATVEPPSEPDPCDQGEAQQ